MNVARMNVPPIVWITAAFAGGIVLAEHRALSLTAAWWLIGGAGSAGALSVVTRRPLLRVLLAIAVFAALGGTHAALHASRQAAWPQIADGRSIVARGVVHAPPESTAGGWRAVVRLHTAHLGEHEPVRPGRSRSGPPPAGPGLPMQSVDGLVRLAGRHEAPAIDVGDEVLIRGHFRIGRPAGNPGERSERDALRRRGLVGVVGTARVGGVAVLRPGGWSVRGAIAVVRRRVIDAARRALPPPRDGLLLSLLLGIDGYLPPEVYQQFSRAGLLHLMVVSGAQIAIVAGALAAVARLARLPVPVTAVLTGLSVAAFAAMVGWAPSIGRAVIMTAVALGGALLGRERDRGATLAAAALGLLAAHPPVLFDIGFQLSFAATWGLLFIAPALRRQVAWLGPKLAAATAATLGAQLAVAPLLAAHFQTVPAAGIIANLLALPLIGVLVPAGFALMPLLVAWPATGAWLLGLLRPGLDALLWISARFGSLSWAAVATPPVPAAGVVVFYAVLGAVVALAAGSWRPLRAQGAAVGASAILAVTVWYAAAIRPPSLLTVTVLDVGQGDAILVQSPSGRTALIDGGGEVGAERTGWDVGRMRVVPALRRAGVRRLDVVLLSHPHEDHVGGLPAVVENFPVGLVLDPGVPHPAPSYARLLRIVEAGRIAYRQAREGVSVDLGSGARLSILYPPDPAPDLDGDAVHARGVVARLTYGQTAFLLTGDAEGPVERYLLDRGAPLASQVLKVGHHGSRTSTTAEFVDRVRPRVAVISSGADNAFGHPHPTTLGVLAAAGSTVLRTDRDGAVRITSDGTTLRLFTFRGAVDARVR